MVYPARIHLPLPLSLGRRTKIAAMTDRLVRWETGTEDDEKSLHIEGVAINDDPE
jgi:hypothetical protein